MKYDPNKLATYVENLLENLIYLDGTERGFALAWDHYQKQFESVIKYVYSKHAYQLSPYESSDLINQTYILSRERGFLEYNGRARLHKLIFFYALKAVKKIAGPPKPSINPPPPPPPETHALRLLNRFFEIGIIDELERELIIARYYVGLSSTEISIRYNISTTNDVDKRINQGKTKIQIYVTIENTLGRGICISDICTVTDRSKNIVEETLKRFHHEKIVKYRMSMNDTHACKGRYFTNL